jgi:hypothetical protein
MGCDIHAIAEVRKDGKWEAVGDAFPLAKYEQELSKKTHCNEPFYWRSYRIFGFLANVRNYSQSPCIQEPTYAIPKDCSQEAHDMFERDYYHSVTFLTARQLLEYDYDQRFEDRRPR